MKYSFTEDSLNGVEGRSKMHFGYTFIEESKFASVGEIITVDCTLMVIMLLLLMTMLI